MDLSPSGLTHDIAIIGGGINGCGIARDAAGRGWSVFLCEQNDLGSGTSSASTKLVHGGLRYLEQYEFRLVREALLEREVLWGIAPHIIWPLRFVLPYHRKLRPRWLLRLGLFLYDHIGGRKKLPPTRVVRLDRDETGKPLKPEFKRGFEYSDCWVEDSRLVVLNARAAADLGATIATRSRCLSAARQDGLWHVVVQGTQDAAPYEIRARCLINAAGPWVGDVSQLVMRDNHRTPVRLVQGSHIVVPKLYDHDGCYIFQNADKRIFFVIPYEQHFTLIGTTDRDYSGDVAAVHATDEEIAYLCRSTSEYLRCPVTPDMVVWTYSGVRPLFDESGDGTAQATTRDYVLKLDAPSGEPALLSVFGGKITTYRRLAEAALAKLAPHLPRAPGQPEGWTGRTKLPGGDFPTDGVEALLAAAAKTYPFLTATHLRRLLRAYGTRMHDILAGARCLADLGQLYGADFTEAELRYLVQVEWVRTAADAVWRRSKLGLRLAPEQIARIDEALIRMAAAPAAFEEHRQ
ncbi:glycerol-3-phosphate dehydrogenase [Lichenicoccus sp.]|uniref:glycerol-3-phosphate dehydrogenase n=1 Tax=Lichenicoccus sp. TaxID=2781899 RepID=UPI003D0A6D72